jgi:adenylate cyclase
VSDRPSLLDEVERTLLGGQPRHTRLDVAERAGVPLERAQRLWRALGLAGTADNDVVFADPAVDLPSSTLVVGFADIVDFTRMSRTIEDADPAEFVDYFEGTAAGMVAEPRGRVIKTIGDEVLFVADTPRDGAGLALDLAARGEPPCPPLSARARP